MAGTGGRAQYPCRAPRLADNRVQYRMARDYLITHSEVALIAMKVSGMAELTRRLETIRREVTSHILPEAGRRVSPGRPGSMRRCADRAPNGEPSLSAGIAIRPAVAGWNAVTLRVGPSKQHTTEPWRRSTARQRKPPPRLFALRWITISTSVTHPGG